MKLRDSLYYLMSIVAFLIGVAGIYFLTEDVWQRLITGTGGIVTSISIFYYFVVNLPSYQKNVVPLLNSLNFWRTARLASVAYMIQGNLNEFREKINDESIGLIPEAEIEWVSEENENSFFDNYKGKVIIRMKPSQNNDENLVKATMIQVSKGTIPESRMYIRPKMNTSIDLSLVRKIMLEQDKKNAYGYFVNEVMLREFEDNEVLQLVESIEIIDKFGLFTRKFLRELKEMPTIGGLGLSNISEIRSDVDNFFKYTLNFAKRKPGEHIPLEFEGSHIRTASILVAQTSRMESEGIKPYVRRALINREKGHEILFIITYGHPGAVNFTRSIINRLERSHGMKLLDNSDKEYLVNGNRYVCATLFTKARIKEIQVNSEIIELLIESVDESLNDEGWASLSEVGSRISLKDPDFDVNNYGFKKMSDFFRSLDIFEVQEIMRDDKVVNVFVRPIDL